MTWRVFMVAVIIGWLMAIAAWAQTTPSILSLIAQYESGDNPTAQNPTSTSSGLYGDVNGTWAEALADCNCGTTAQYPNAASAPASIQTAAEAALLQQNGLSDYTCTGCDPALTNAINADGGSSAFSSQIAGLSTDPASYASLDTSAGLADFLGSTGTATSGPGITVTAATAPATGTTSAATGGLTGGLTTPPALTTQVPDGPPPTSGVLDQIITTFGNATSGWQAKLATIATDLFWLLAAIEFFVMIIGLVLQGERPNWWDAVPTIVYWLFPIGLFWWLLQNGSTYTADIVNSMRQAGGALGGDAITPSAILSAGVALVSQVWQYTHLSFNPAVLAAEMIALVVIMICFAQMAVWMAATIIEAYFIIGASSLFFAFGGLRWSRQIGISVLLFCLGIGAKLFAMEAIVAIATTFVQNWLMSTAEMGFQAFFTMIGLALFLASLAKIVPDTMQRVILSAPVSLAHYSQPVREAASAGALVAGAGAAVGGFGTLAVQALIHAAERQTDSSQPGQSGLARSLQFAGAATGAVARAAGSEIGARLGGFARGGVGASAVRMAQNVAQQRRIAAAQRAQTGGNTP
jgi:type IV secretion system protein TrbL